jgi:PAS domain S-box-containing protein
VTIEKANILVVDDEFGMREGIKRLLEIQGHTIETAENGTEGIEKGTAFEYDLYLLDLKMGDVDGTEVLRAIKEAYPEAICVIITAYASIDTAVETTQLGAYHYLAKPFTPETLQPLLDRALERRWYILEARRLQAEQERRLLEVAHEKSRVRTVINAIDDGIVVLNQDREVVLFNPRFLQLLNIQGNISIGDSIETVLDASVVDQMNEAFKKAESLEAIKQEIVLEPPAKLVLMVNSAPVVNDNQEMIGLVSVFRDISELKQIERYKSQFVNMAAHELKAPLSAIKGYIELIVDQTLGDTLDAYNRHMNRSLERINALVTLIDDLLNISRMEAGTVRHEIARVDLSELLLQSVEFFTPDLKKKALTFQNDIDPGLVVKADPEEIRRIFNNLISNAIKYNKEEGQVGIEAHKEGHYIKISVWDTGIGLKPEEKDRLFEEFFRAKNPLTRNITGTGLGLTIIKKIVDSYAGKITVESEFEQGSRFTVYLPGVE